MYSCLIIDIHLYKKKIDLLNHMRCQLGHPRAIIASPVP